MIYFSRCRILVLGIFFSALLPSWLFGQCTSLDFTASKQRACIFDVINFNPVNIPAGSQVQWVIGNDTALVADTLFWIFNRTGVFDVELIVTNGGSPCSVRKNRYIMIGVPVNKPPILVASKAVCGVGDTLTISNNSPNALSHSWSIGNHYYPDTIGTIQHVFGSDGYFRINLKFIDSNGCVALNSLDSIHVMKEPVLKILASQKSFCAPDSVSFSFTSKPSQSYASVKWTFTGASPGSSTATAPAIKYANPGVYNVRLEVTNNAGCKYKVTDSALIKTGVPHNLPLQLSTHYVCTQTKFTAQTAIGGLDPANLSWKLTGATVDGDSKPDSQIISYASSGKKVIKLEYNDNGCLTDTADTVQVVSLTPNFTADKTCGCNVPMSVNFNANSTSYSGQGTLTYNWNFYNGSSSSTLGTSTQKNPSFNYTVAGKHEVELVVSDGNGCAKEIRKNEFIRIEPLKATISADPATVCPGQTVSFSTKPDSTCQSGLTNFSWRFYDLNGTSLLGISKSDKPTFSYNNLGTYAVSLAIANQQGCSDSVKLPAVVTVGKLEVDFTADDTALCSGSSTRLRLVNNTGIAATATWTVTDASTGNVVASTTGNAPNVKFSSPGIYSVKLVAQVAGSCSDSILKTSYIKVNEISANITANDTGGCIPFSTLLHANVVNQNIAGNAGTVTINWLPYSANSPVAYSNNAAENTTASIPAKGCFGVKLKVSNSGGCTFTDERQDFLCAGVAASFTAPSRGCRQEHLKLTNTSSFNAKSFKWLSSRPEGHFIPSSTDTNPSFYATADGPFAISLIVRDTFNCTDTFTKVLDIDHFKADFATPDTGGQCSPAFISFQVTAAGADSFFWNFGDGQKLSTIQHIASNLYDLQNSDSLNNFYDVTLVAKSFNGCYDTVMKPEFVNVIGPFLKFTYLNKIGCEPLGVRFADSNQSVLSFLFDYGDSSPISSNQVTSHIYMAQPFDTLTIYRPTIIATDNKGCVRQFTPADSIVVYKEPTADFTVSSTKGCEPFEVTFTGNSSFATKYYWDFENDGIVDDSTENPVHAFAAGTYTVKLVVESPYGCTDSMIVSQLITSFVNPTAKMDFDTTVVCFLADVNFYDLSTGPVPLAKRWWDFGDTTNTRDTSSAKNPYYIYQSPGFYSPSLIVEDTNGCRDTQIYNAVEVVDTVPLPYSGLKYVTVNAKNQVELVWNNDQIRGFKHYLLFRQGPGGFLPFDTIAQETKTQLTDTIPKPQNGSICYDIQIQINCLTKSLLGKEHCTIWLQTQKGGEREIDLNWTPYQGWSQVFGYRIYRSDGGAFTEIALVNNQTQYVDTGLCDREYCYYVVAIHPAGYLSSSNRSCTTPDYRMQTTPLMLYRTTVENDEVTLTEWERGEDANISQYLIDRYSASAGWWVNYDSTTNTNFIDDEALVHQQSYMYRVRLENDCGIKSPESNPGTSIFLLVTNENDAFLLQWSAYHEFDQGVNQYHVEKEQPDGSFKLLETVSANDTFLLTTDVDFFATLNCYRVKAEENKTGRLSLSNIACNILASRMHIPSAFSPNNDSLNDRFYVYGIFIEETGVDKIHEFVLNIYSRWGEKLWSTQNIREGWDGKYRGELVPEGVYLYTVQAKGVDGETFYKKGTVTLRR